MTILFPGALGDFLLALPALRALRARHPQAHCTVVVGEPLRALVALAGLADTTASLDGPELAHVLAAGPRPAWLAPGGVVYSWLGAVDAVMRERIAVGAAAARFFRVERGPDGPHAAVAYARAVGAADDRASLIAAGRILAPPSARLDALRLAGPVLVLHGGAGARRKRWDPAGFAAVAGWWRVTGGTAVAILGPAEHGEEPPDGATGLRDWPLPDLADVLARATLYVGNDSGVSHLAGAVGVRGLVLFGATDPARWAPIGGPLPVRAAAAGADHIDLASLPPGRVIAACRDVLQTSPARPPTGSSP